MLSPKIYLSALVERGYIDANLSEKLELEALQSHEEIETVILKYNLAPKDALLEAKARCLNVPSVLIDKVAVNPQALSLIPKMLAIRHNILGFKINEAQHVISVATTDPLNLNLQNFLEQKTGYHIEFCLAYQQDIEKAIATSYSQSFAPEVSQALEENKELLHKTIADTSKDTQKTGDESPIIKIVDTIMDFASQSRASDIHIEPQQAQTRVRYRIDGILQEKLSLPSSLHDSLVSRLKIMSGLKLDERRIPQDGRFSIGSGKTEADIRVSTLPTVYGEKVVMRLLRKSGGLPTLSEIGLHHGNLHTVQDAISRPYGIILVTGPTGSGKTTTLYSVLTMLNKPSTNIMTLEDPVEYQINGINQVQINPQAGLTFASGLRSFLRQDPNIILIGEIRDTETTQLAVQAALTGHLVFATLHTNSAATAIPRLTDLGAEPFLISSALICTVAQRIARQICPHCKISYTPSIEEMELLNNELRVNREPLQLPNLLYKGAGCEQCDHTGYYGRIGIFEVLSMSAKINQLIIQHASAGEIERQARNEGMITMRQDGLLKAVSGLTTIEEILRLTQ